MIVSSLRKFGLLSVLAVSALALSGCATRGDHKDSLSEDEIIDPLEGLNRAVFGINEAVDILYLGPASTIYHEGVPDPIQDVVRNFFRNLEMPVIAMNKLLQGNVDGFGTAVGRFFVNSIAGVGGLADVASSAGLPYEDTDFGITLASWGVDPGFYVVLPLLGPSSARDGIGKGVDWLADPVRIVAYNNDLEAGMIAVSALRLLDTRAGVDAAIQDTRTNSLDTYAAMRSLYAQHRAGYIRKQLGPGHR
jgi:phospholipid-binding lipoprotein MlaA